MGAEVSGQPCQAGSCAVSPARRQRPMRRRDFLERDAAVAAALLAGRGGAPGTQAASAHLRTQAAAQGLLYGSALGWPRLTDADYLERFGQECGILVPENELKWLAL